MKYFDISETVRKVPAGWLIEQTGFKGVLVTPEYTKSGFGFSKLWRATGQEILNVSRLFRDRFQNFWYSY
jgi:UDP-N-acetylmuramate dehydrogenase